MESNEGREFGKTFVEVDERIHGLLYCEGFLSGEEENELVKWIDSRRWKDLGDGRRRVQNHGGFPHEKGMIVSELPSFFNKVCDRLVESEVFDVDTKPNHVLVNEYQPGTGIEAHVDGPVYEPRRAAIVSLSSPIVMNFTRLDNNEKVCDVLLNPSSCLILKDQAYLQFKHAIQPFHEDKFDSDPCNLPRNADVSLAGQTIPRTRRISLTLRRVRPLKAKLRLFPKT
mmetsp:Transcript_12308/g.22240  ORF Transcript_12308/g.22240 Transcript_12308/m.22240 type:complete len:227 (+) Transcript_12308:488-1168(+)